MVAAAAADVNVVEIMKKDKKEMKGREAMTTTKKKKNGYLCFCSAFGFSICRGEVGVSSIYWYFKVSGGIGVAVGVMFVPLFLY